LTYFLAKKLLTNAQGFPQVLIGQLEQLPIAKANKEQQTEIIKLVEQLLHLNAEKQSLTLSERIEQIQSKIDYCEDKINDLVYDLYGLTSEEKKIVEGE